MRRGLTLGARACVIDAEGRMLLVRHSYTPGWQFPGGGVEWGETVEAALVREVKEETGVEVAGKVDLHGVFANFAHFPGDHVVLYVIRQWRRPTVPRPNAEIVETAFHSPAALPPDVTPGTRRRVAEIIEDRTASPQW
jgi:ADP-ribose pyrophosphatase YjhB (NUDIX family)